jgi:hypothetical protein
MAQPERVDVVTDDWPLQCQACLTVLPQTPGLPGLAGAPDFVAHQVTELPVIHPRITEYRLHLLACPSCGTRTRAFLPGGVPAGSFGPRVQATVAILGGRLRLSLRETSGVMGQVSGVPISIGSVDALCQATGEALAPVTAALVATLPTAPLLPCGRDALAPRWTYLVAVDGPACPGHGLGPLTRCFLTGRHP